jgi:hypothetical protein
MNVSWVAVIATLTTFIYIFVPLFLWSTDLVLKKVLGNQIFKVQWNRIMILISILLWIIDRIWVYFNNN